MRKFFIVICLILISIGCSIFQKDLTVQQKVEKLQKQLDKWQSFTIDGIIEINHKQYDFRKNIHLKRRNNHFRLDIYDSGIMGLSPSPYLTIICDSSLTVRTENSSLKEQINESFEDYSEVLRHFKTKLILENHKDIIDNLKFETSIASVSFYPNFRLKIIKKDKISVEFKYHTNYELQKIIIYSEKKEIANIIIDKVHHGKISEIKNE